MPKCLQIVIFCILSTGINQLAQAVDHSVTVGGASLTYSPAMLSINVGDTVTFTNAGGFHNVASDPGAVTSFHCSTACGSSPTGDPAGGAWSQQITFSTAGTVGYHCEAHGSPGLGMFGTITVNPVPVSLQSFDVE